MTQLHEIDPNKTEWEAKDGAFYCPECGQRYDTAGVCEGTAEAGHPPVAVEEVKGKKTSTGGKDDKKDENGHSAGETGKGKGSTAGKADKE